MPGCDSPRCRSSCGARAQRPPCQIDSLKSARPITIPLVDYQCCGALRNRRSIAWGKTGTTMGATRVSISACPLLSPSHPGLKNRRQLLQPTELTAASSSLQQDSRARLAGRARRDGNPIYPRRAFLACLALHVPRLVALADFFSILLAPIAQLEHKDRPCQQQRDGIGQNDRPGMKDQSIQKPEEDTG
jgi:hypothetical protein